MRAVWEDMTFRWILLGFLLMPIFVNVGYWTYCDLLWQRKSVEFKDCLKREFGNALKEKLSNGDRDARVSKLCASHSPTKSVRVWESGDQILVLNDSTGGIAAVWKSRTIKDGVNIKAHTDGLSYDPYSWIDK